MNDNQRTNEHDLRKDAVTFAVALATSPNAAAPTASGVLDIANVLLTFLRAPVVPK